jgi:putative ABC transport system substrate-binding protein
LERKRLELLCEVRPDAATIGLLINPSNQLAETQIEEAQQAATLLGKQVLVLQASRDEDLDAAFTLLGQRQITALAVVADPFFYSRRAQLTALSARAVVPTMFPFREFATDGGLMSYGTSPLDVWRIIGNYTGRILKGARPADLPVQQATRVELVLNLRAAKAFGLAFPLTFLGRADEVIE